jgi:hypothetical protein
MDQGNNNSRDAERIREARRILDRVDRESAAAGDSALARAASRMRKHFSASDEPTDDNVEIWGKRIGRTLGLALFLFLLVYLARTYLFG